MPRRQGRCFHATASRVLPDRHVGRARYVATGDRPAARGANGHARGDRPRTATGRTRRRSPAPGAGRVRRQGDDDDLLRTHVTSGGELARTDEKTKITTLR